MMQSWVEDTELYFKTFLTSQETFKINNNFKINNKDVQ